MNGKRFAERIFYGSFGRHESTQPTMLNCGMYNAPNPNNLHKINAVKEMPAVSKPNGGDLTLKQFLEKYSLPRIVKIIPEEPIASAESSDPAALLNGALLLYKQYRSGKIEGKKFCDSRNAKLTTTAILEANKEVSTIVIPDTYQGWFSVMTERGQVKARQYTTMQRLIAAQVTAFLIIGPDLIGYYQNYHKTADGARSRYQYIKMTVRSGQILKLLAVYEDIAEQSTRSKRLSWPLLGSKQQSTQYAQCMTVKKQIVYIPITTHGSFYAVSTANNTAEDNVSKVYQIAKLLQVFPLPVRVCSIYPQKINGSILLETYHKEDVMLACVLEEKQITTNSGSMKFRFLEIDVNSKFYVHLVLDEHRLFKKTRVQKALRSCHADSDKWCQQLKVIHHIYPSTGPPKINPIQDENNKPTKKTRRISLGDKKTVKSASFKYSTSYGLEDIKPLYRNISPPEVLHKAVQTPPVYLNIAHKPNDENCSSLPTQKSDRSVFENEIIQSLIQQSQRCAPTNRASPPSESQRVKNDKIIKKNSSSNDCAANSSYQNEDKRVPLVTNNHDYRIRVTKNNYINARDLCGNKVPKYSDPRYRVVKKEYNYYGDKELMHVARQQQLQQQQQPQPIYKTQVVVRIDDSYSDVIDAIKLSKSSSSDNIYTEINNYQSEINNPKYPIHFTKKASCFVNDNCTSSYIVVPSTSAVNVT